MKIHRFYSRGRAERVRRWGLQNSSFLIQSPSFLNKEFLVVEHKIHHFSSQAKANPVWKTKNTMKPVIIDAALYLLTQTFLVFHAKSLVLYEKFISFDT